MPTTQVEASVAIHNILFATDFTEASKKAFKYTKAVARHFQASVITAHVIRASVSDWPQFGTNPQYQKLCRDTKQMLDRLSRQLHQAGFQADTALLDGDPVEGILKAVKHHKADLLVLGTHGSRDLERFVLGSTAEEILRKTKCPVLTIGPNVQDPDRGTVLFRRILLATDFSPEAAAAAPYAFSLAAEHSSHISVCHVLPEGHVKSMDATELQAKFMHALRKFMPEDTLKKCAAEYVVESGNAAEEILDLADKQNADLIVLGVRSASIIATHLLAGIAFRVISGASCPVLTIRR
jgi:nucleotide-binding universal stress UspA family protein